MQQLLVRLIGFVRFIAQLVPSSVSNIFRSFFKNGLLKRGPWSSNFTQEYEQHYPGITHPSFFEGSYQDALRYSKANYQFLVVFLHSELHYNSAQFCRQVLSNQEVINALHANFVLWGGDVSNSNAFQVQSTLAVCDFPALLVIGAVGPQNQQVLVQRIEGTKTAAQICEQLQNVMELHGTALIAARLESEERALERRLREEQDQAYQQAVLEDQLRQEAEKQAHLQQQAQIEAERQRVRNEEERHARAEAEKQREIERKIRLREEKRRNLPAEPSEGPNVVTLAFRTRNGRLTRRFMSSDPLQLVKNYVDTADNSMDFNDENTCLVIMYPRKVLSDLTITLKDAGIVSGTALVLEEMVKED